MRRRLHLVAAVLGTSEPRLSIAEARAFLSAWSRGDTAAVDRLTAAAIGQGRVLATPPTWHRDPLPTHAWFAGERNGIAFAVLLEVLSPGGCSG